MSSHTKKASVTSPPLIMTRPVSTGSKRPAAAMSSDASSNSVNSVSIPSNRSMTGKRLDNQAESSSSGSIRYELSTHPVFVNANIKMLSKDPERYKAQGVADLATHVNNYKGPCRLFDNFDLEIMAKAFRNVLRADLQRVTEQKALKEGVLHVIQNFEYPEDWYIVPMTFEKMKPSNHRAFADIVGDMVKTGSIRITDAADLTVEEVLDWEAKNQDTRKGNASNVEGNRCIAD